MIRFVRCLSSGRIALATLFVVLVMGCQASHAISKTVILQLQSAARTQYSEPGDDITRYNIMVFRGKAYATTRGSVKGVETISVWEYVPKEWHLIFDYPMTEAHTAEITQHFRSYGFTATQQKWLLAKSIPFPDP